MEVIKDKCLIWGTHAHTREDTAINGFLVNSLRAGGWYRITKEALQLLKAENNQKIFFAKLTTLLVDQRRIGEPSPLIKKDVLNKVKNKKIISIDEKINRFLLYCNEKSGQQPWKKFATIDIRKTYDTYPLSVAIEAMDINFIDVRRFSQSSGIEPLQLGCQELFDFIEMLQDQELIKSLYDVDQQAYFVNLTSEGIRRLERCLTRPNRENKQAFVAMWFDDSMDSVYENSIKLAVKEMGYTPVRIDKMNHNNKIDDKIISEIKKSTFLIADFSQGPDGARGGVYYEAGFAHGLNIPVIFTCRKNDENKLHFDTRQFNHIIWENEEDLKKKLQDRIGATIGQNQVR